MSNARNIASYGNIVGGLVGEIKMWPVSTSPLGYLLCNGQSVSTTTYANLFNVIGYTFGGSGGSFLLPNYTDTMPVGAGNLYALANTGGSNNAVVVSHSHGLNDQGHSHTTSLPAYWASGNSGGITFFSGSAAGSSGYNGVSSSQTTGITANTAGVSGLGANMPPYLGIYFIIRYL